MLTAVSNERNDSLEIAKNAKITINAIIAINFCSPTVFTSLVQMEFLSSIFIPLFNYRSVANAKIRSCVA